MKLMIINRELKGEWQSVLLDADKPYPDNFLCGIWDEDKDVARGFTHVHALEIERKYGST